MPQGLEFKASGPMDKGERNGNRRVKERTGVKIINPAHRLDRKEECRKETEAIGWDQGDYVFFAVTMASEVIN
jgi:hypothetical protein